MTALDWSKGACVGMPTFDRLPIPDQKAICKQCPATVACLAWALEYERDHKVYIGSGGGWPVYAGLTIRERMQIGGAK